MSQLKKIRSLREIGFDDYKIKGLSKRFVDASHSITGYLYHLFKVPLPESNQWINASYFMNKRFELTIPYFAVGSAFHD